MLSAQAVEIFDGLDESDLFYMVEDAWRELCGGEIAIAQSAAPVPDATIASVEINGPFQGAVLIECGEEIARNAAAFLFKIPIETVDEEHQSDVLGELVNIVGGVIKGCLEGHSTLSLPMVVTGVDSSTLFRDATELARIAMDSGGHSVILKILRRSGH